MSAVLKFPDKFERVEWRARKAASEASKLAGLHGYGLRASQQFQVAAYRMAEHNPHLSPSACAARCVPHKQVALGDLPDGAA